MRTKRGLIVASNIDNDLAQTGRHRDGKLDVERLFGVTAGRAECRRAVGRNKQSNRRGQRRSKHIEVIDVVRWVGANELQQSKLLTRTCECPCRTIVGKALKITAKEEAAQGPIRC